MQAAKHAAPRRVVGVHLAHDEHLGARVGDRFPDDLLRAPLAVHLGGVDEPDPELESESERGDFAGALAAPLAHAPRPQPQTRASTHPSEARHQSRWSSSFPCSDEWRACDADAGACDLTAPALQCSIIRRSRHGASSASSRPIRVECTPNRARRLPARLPGYVRAARQRRGRARGRIAGDPDAPDNARHALHQGRALSRAHLFRPARAASVAPRRRQGRRPLRADQLGRGAGHDCRALQGHRRLARRTTGDRPVQLRGNDGLAAIRLDGPALFQQARRIAARSDDLLDGRQGGLHRHDRRGGRDRPRAVRERAPDPDLGIESHRLQPALVEPGAGSEASRREADRHRPVPQPDRREMPRPPRAAAGHRRRAGARNDARADRATTLLDHDYIDRATRLDSSNFANACTSSRRSARRRDHGPSGRRRSFRWRATTARYGRR